MNVDAAKEAKRLHTQSYPVLPGLTPCLPPDFLVLCGCSDDEKTHENADFMRVSRIWYLKLPGKERKMV